MAELSDYIVYVDETGDHGLENINPHYPVFALACCIFEKTAYVDAVVPAMQRLKFDYWGHDAVILHSHDIRKLRRGPYKIFLDAAVRRAFMEDLNAVIGDAAFTLVVAVIDKQAHIDRYAYPANPYDIALLFCMERVYAFLRDRGQHERETHFVVEGRGKKEDDALELAFLRIAADEIGNQWGPMPGFKIVFARKQVNSTGLQFADLVGHPIGRHAIRPNQANRAYDIIQGKFRRSPGGRIQGWGLKTFP